ncbi:hypothetical protein ACNKHT_19530 [Shigella flexneri]
MDGNRTRPGLAWRLPEQSSTILVLNKAGRIQSAKDRQPDARRGQSCHCVGAKPINE